MQSAFVYIYGLENQDARSVQTCLMLGTVVNFVEGVGVPFLGSCNMWFERVWNMFQVVSQGPGDDMDYTWDGK